MSRSRKKVPIITDYSRKGTKFNKRLAAKAVRNYKGIIPDGCKYKYLFCSYNICDYKIFWDKPESYRK